MTKKQRTLNTERQSSSINSVEKTKQPHAKKQTYKKTPDKTRPLSHKKHKNQLKTD